MITLYAFGPFRLVDGLGQDVTPRAMKARAVLALLALAPAHRRTRSWLQDKLWSDRSAKQGSDSLRQALLEIRRSLGGSASILISDREMVCLDRDRFSLVRGAVGGEGLDSELFADLNVADAEFEQWIRDRRMEPAWSAPMTGVGRAPVATRRSAPAIFFALSEDRARRGDLTIVSLMSLMTTSLLDFADFEIFHPGNEIIRPGPPPEQGLLVRLAHGRAFGGQRLHISISDIAERRIFWSKGFSIPYAESEEDEAAIVRIGAETVESILSTFRTWSDVLDIDNCAAFLLNRARQSIFRFDKSALRQADQDLAQAYAYEARPQTLAWRAFLRNIAKFQHRTAAFLRDQVDIDTLAHEALRDAPGSAISLGVRAHIEYLSGGSQRSSLQLAQRAVEADPLNAINHAILSNTELVLGKRNASRASSLMALSLSGSAEHRSFVEFFCCMSAAALDDYEQATDHAEAAAALRPAFVAPLRYLVALYTQAGRTSAVQRATALLRVSEPDFRPERLLDPDYPVTTLRRIRLIEAIGRSR